MSKRKATDHAAVVHKARHSLFDRVSLANRLVQSGKVSNVAAARAVNEFFDRFMPLKKSTNDADGSLIAPSHVVAHVWRLAVAHTAAYAEFCESQIGFFVHHKSFDGDLSFQSIHTSVQ